MIAVEENEKIRIVHFIECWLPQTATWLFNHVRALPENVSSNVVCQWTENLDQFPSNNIFSTNRPPARLSLGGKLLRRFGLWDEGARHLKLLERVIQNEKPDVLHSHFGYNGWRTCRLADRYGLPHIVSFYGMDVGYLPKSDPRWHTRYREMGNRVDRVVCEGPYMAKQIASVGVDKNKIEVFRLGIDLERFPFAPRPNVSRNGKLRILIAGSFREKKGIPYALEAIGMLQNVFANFEVTVIGDAAANEREQLEKGKILDQVRRWGLQSKATFLGYQPYERLCREFSNHDVFLSPSVTAADGDSEGGAPVTIIEAAASGLPVVSTTHCDIPFVLSEMNRRYLVPERDSVALFHALEELVSLENWEPIQFANRRMIEQELNVAIQAKKLGGIYNRLASSNASK